jgi:galactokinase
MTHEEKMRKMEMDHQARMAEIRRKGEETCAAIDRVIEENNNRFEQVRAAMNANNFEEMTRLMKEISESTIQVRKLLSH